MRKYFSNVLTDYELKQNEKTKDFGTTTSWCAFHPDMKKLLCVNKIFDNIYDNSYYYEIALLKNKRFGNIFNYIRKWGDRIILTDTEILNGLVKFLENPTENDLMITCTDGCSILKVSYIDKPIYLFEFSLYINNYTKKDIKVFANYVVLNRDQIEKLIAFLKS